MKLLNKEDVLNLIKYAMWDTDDVTPSEAQIALKWLWNLHDDIKIKEKIKEVPAIPVEWVVNWLTRQHIPATHTCDDYYAVEMMLDDWEKENE